MAFVKSTFDIFVFGKIVYRVLSLDGSNFVVNTLKSLTSRILDVGRAPSQIPVTVLTKDIYDKVTITKVAEYIRLVDSAHKKETVKQTLNTISEELLAS